MIAYKGTNPDVMSVLGNGKSEKCQLIPGVKFTEEKSKTADSGYHCCENPFDCLTYYGYDGKNRFWKVEAAGDIDEDSIGRISCTEITLLEELTPLSFAKEGMKYMIKHMDRDGWEKKQTAVHVLPDEAFAKKKGDIAIARGKNPRVRGAAGSICGLIVEDDRGWCVNAKLYVVPERYADIWITLSAGNKCEVSG